MGTVPTLSIITPVFNSQNYIASTVDSVLHASTQIDFEYLVINDGSTDATAEILRSFGDKIRVRRFQNAGESVAVNRGLELAAGKYVLVVNADDPILDGSLFDLAVEILDHNPHIVAVYPDWQIIDSEGAVKRIIKVDDFSLHNLVVKNRCLPGPGTIFRRECALEINGRDPRWKYVSDYDFWLRLSQMGDFHRLAKVLGQWRQHDFSTSVTSKNSEMANERIQVINSFLATSKFSKDLQRMAISNSYYLAARLSYFDPRINGKQLFIKGLKFSMKWPSEANFFVVMYLLLLPISRHVSKIIPSSLIRKFIK